jgi:hypothetical protein
VKTVKNTSSECWWLLPVILATQEAEIRRIEAQSYPGHIDPGGPILKKPFTKNRAGGIAQGEDPEFNPQLNTAKTTTTTTTAHTHTYTHTNTNKKQKQNPKNPTSVIKVLQKLEGKKQMKMFI